MNQGLQSKHGCNRPLARDSERAAGLRVVRAPVEPPRRSVAHQPLGRGRLGLRASTRTPVPIQKPSPEGGQPDGSKRADQQRGVLQRSLWLRRQGAADAVVAGRATACRRRQVEPWICSKGGGSFPVPGATRSAQDRRCGSPPISRRAPVHSRRASQRVGVGCRRWHVRHVLPSLCAGSARNGTACLKSSWDPHPSRASGHPNQRGSPVSSQARTQSCRSGGMNGASRKEQEAC